MKKRIAFLFTIFLIGMLAIAVRVQAQVLSIPDRSPPSFLIPYSDNTVVVLSEQGGTIQQTFETDVGTDYRPPMQTLSKVEIVQRE